MGRTAVKPWRVGLTFAILVVVSLATACSKSSPGVLPTTSPSAVVSSTSPSPTPTTLSGTAVSLAWSVSISPTPAGLDGELDAIAVGPDGNVYLVDTGMSRVVVYSPDGKMLRSWGEEGTGQGQFDFVRSDHTYLIGGIAVAPDGSVFVAEEGNYRIQKFDPQGKYLTAWGSNGSTEGKFNRLIGVSVDTAGDVYAADGDAINFTVQKFDPDGVFISQLGPKGMGPDQISLEGGAPAGVGPNGHIYLADNNGGVVFVFDQTGAVLSKFGSVGTGDGQLIQPGPIALDANGNLFVVDYGNDRIEEFDPEGRFVATIRLDGLGLPHPDYVAIGPAGELYAVDATDLLLAKVMIGP